MKGRPPRRHARGFTLVELVIVVAVIAILAALLVPTILGATDRAREGRALTDVASIGQTAARCRSDTGSTSATCLTANNFLNLQVLPAPGVCGTNLPRCEVAPPGTLCWAGPYMPAIGQDPWGNDYVGSVDATSKLITVTSSGPDGVAGTSDDLTWQG